MSLFSPTYVIKSWNVQDGDSHENTVNYVAISGRSAGLISWFLSKVGLDPTIDWNISSEYCEYKSSSIFGYSCHVTPTQKISSFLHGYSKPIVALFLGICGFIASFLSLLGLFNAREMTGPLFLLFILIAFTGWMIYRYKTDQTLFLGTVSVSGLDTSFKFKSSIIEGQLIDEKSAAQATRVIENIIAAANR